MTDFAEWIGRQRSHRSSLDPWPSSAFHASTGSLAEPVTGELPLLWHWLYFLEAPQRSRQGEDGHPRKGDFFPPIDNPRRMFVSARTRTHRPLVIAADAELEETILACAAKSGASGEMIMLTVGYQYRQAGNLCVEEERDFMYLPARAVAEQELPCDEEVAIPPAQWSWDVPTDPVLLFKYSALTFNGHRIHYDRDYARDVEAYPELVVQGPLTALLLAELARAELGRPLTGFSFRARAPLYAGDRLRLRGEPQPWKNSVQLMAYRPDGKLAMTAEAG
jgi:3-methylfumaryl-CoA hydratase